MKLQREFADWNPAPRARAFRPYRARDRPVSDSQKRVGKRHGGKPRDRVQPRVRVCRGYAKVKTQVSGKCPSGNKYHGNGKCRGIFQRIRWVENKAGERVWVVNAPHPPHRAGQRPSRNGFLA